MQLEHANLKLCSLELGGGDTLQPPPNIGGKHLVICRPIEEWGGKIILICISLVTTDLRCFERKYVRQKSRVQRTSIMHAFIEPLECEKFGVWERWPMPPLPGPFVEPHHYFKLFIFVYFGNCT